MPQDQPKTELTLDEFREQARERYGIPKGLWESVREQESGGDINAVSKTGVRGELQVTKKTARAYGMDRDDPFHQVAAGARNLREGYDRYKNQFADENERWLAATSYYYYGDDGVAPDGTLSTKSKDGVSNPAEHVTNVAKRWKAYNDSQSEQKAEPAPARDPARQAKPRRSGVAALLGYEPSSGDPYGDRKALRRRELAGLIAEFEDYKQQGRHQESTEIAQELKRRGGDLLEVAEGTGGWWYVKPKPGSGFSEQEFADAAARLNESKAMATEMRREGERQEFARRSLTEQIGERAHDAFARGGGNLSKMARRAAGLGLGAVQGLQSGRFEMVDFPEWRAGEEARMRGLEERRLSRPSSFASEVGEGIIEAVPTAAGALGLALLTGGSAPAVIGSGAGISALGADWEVPKRAAVQTALGGLAPYAGGRIGANVAGRVAPRLAVPAAQAATRVGGELGGGGLGNVLATGGEQLAFEGRLDPRELAKSALIGGALSTPGAMTAARRPLPSASGVDQSVIESASRPQSRAPITVTRAGRGSTFGRAGEIPRVGAQDPADIGIRQAIDRYTKRADEINRSNIDPGAKAAQLAQARAAFRAEREAAKQVQPPTEAPSTAPDAVATPAASPELPPGVRIVRQGETPPARERGQRQIPMDVDRGDGAVETVIVLAPERIGGQRVNETMLRPIVESAIRNPQSAIETQPAQPAVAQTGATTAEPPLSQSGAPARRQPAPIQFTQLGPEGLRTARAPEEALLPQPRSRATNTLQRDPGGAILAPASSLPSRKLLAPGRPEDVPTERLDAPDTREMPAIRQRIEAENALTAELPTPDAPETQRIPVVRPPRADQSARPTAELPRQPAITQEPTDLPGPRRKPTERLPVPKATDENIEALRKRQEDLGRLAYDRRGDFTGDLRDEYNQLHAAIRDYDNAQAKIELGGRLEDAPPPGMRPERMTPPPEEREARRAALQPRTAEFPEATTPGRPVTKEVQVPGGLKKAESHASREDARQGHFERFTDAELVDEIRRMEDARNAAIRGRSKLTPAEIEANNFDLRIAVEMQKERARIQRAQGREPEERIEPRTPGRSFKEAEAGREGRKINHSQFGEVTEAADQRGVRKGQLRVVDAEGKPHIIKNPRIAGNREAAFVKPSTGAIPAEAMPELRAKGAPPSPLERMGKPLPTRGRQSYAIPDAAMPELRDRPKPRFVTDAEQRLKDATSGKVMGSGTRQIADIAIVTGYKVYEAGMDFARWSAEVVRQAGEQVRPHLRAAWDQIQANKQTMAVSGQIASRMARIARTPTSPVEISKLRAEFPDLSKADFDAAMERLNAEGRIALHRHDHPASLSDAERAQLVKIGDDYFIAATFRERPGTVMGMGFGALQGMSTGKGAAKATPAAKPDDLTFRERLGRKIGTAQTMAQLLNPKTIAQNVIGNAAFSGAKNAATFAAIPVDKFLSFVTKKRQVSTPELRTQFRDFSDGFADMYHAVRSDDYAALADNRYELNNERVFKGKIGGFFEDALNIALRAPDRGAYLAAYNDSVQQILKAHGKSKTKFSLDKIHEQAKIEAQQVVFQDSNIISNFTVDLRNLLNKITPFGERSNFGLGDLVGLKYARTPANLVARGIEYSPLNFVNAFYKMGKVLAGKGRDFDQRAASLAFGKAFVGSAFGSGMGALLQAMGIITQPEQENRGVQAAERAEGLMGYQLNLSALKRYASGGLLDGSFEAGKKQAGDKLMSYDWLQPWAFSIGMGAAAIDAAMNRKADASTLDNTLTQIDAVTSTLTDQSILRNIRDAFRFGPKSTGRKIVTDAPASFVPSVLNQARTIIDDRAREISKEKGGAGMRREALEKVLNRLPGASKRLPERKDIIGRSTPSRLPGKPGAALATVPGRFAEFRPHPVLSEMQETGSGTTGIQRKDGESEGQFRARRAMAAQWLNEYGMRLTTSKAYRESSRDERKAALDELKRTISGQSDERNPKFYLFAPSRVMDAALRSERERRRKAAASALQ